VGNLIANLRTLSNGRLITLMGAGAAILLALVYLTMKMAAPPLVPLYTGIESEAAGTVLQRLDQMGVTYQVQGESTILVPADQAARLRMTLAADGLPSGGPVGYELLDSDQGLGVTRFQEDIRYLRALEGELARSIRTLNSIANARVHLVLPKREPFQRQAPQPTASVLVVMRGAATLGREQVMAIQYLVAQAVPSLKPQSVSIIDQQGTLLAGSTDDGQGQSAAQAADARAASKPAVAFDRGNAHPASRPRQGARHRQRRCRLRPRRREAGDFRSQRPGRALDPEQLADRQLLQQGRRQHRRRLPEPPAAIRADQQRRRRL
jgi:flagellar M-ring protein FliF